MLVPTYTRNTFFTSDLYISRRLENAACDKIILRKVKCYTQQLLYSYS